MRVIERVTVGKRGDGTLIRVEGQPNWFSLICVRGKQHEISTGTPDLKLAKRFHCAFRSMVTSQIGAS